ncbi:hypothetical protein E2K93_12430 [Thalassotalea sp. HSM 43]|uniref:hypothetical protein n=1 Tax=Thalassotalea sp. HSM 43 TaxID=2552945 RepID=UPI001081082D|nr:hypothetical protein [Thalassotalea sp. HSM 43]QBY05139.1 hypothetical protein E2K93_12430 [Thalassotalea sp. HSM 43]
MTKLNLDPLSSQTDLYGDPIPSAEAIFNSFAVNSDELNYLNVGCLYLHYDSVFDEYYLGANNAVSNPERATDVEAKGRTDAYYDPRRKWAVVGVIKGLNHYETPDDPVTVYHLEHQCHKLMRRYGHKLINRVPVNGSTQAKAPWNHGMCKQRHQLMQYYLAPTLWNIYNETEIRHGRHEEISDGSNPNNLKRVNTMANDESSSCHQLNWVTNWFLSAMGEPGKVSSNGNGLSSWFNRHTDSTPWFTDVLMSNHSATDWAKKLDYRLPSPDEVQLLVEFFNLYVAIGDGDFEYLAEPMIKLRHNPPTNQLMEFLG